MPFKRYGIYYTPPPGPFAEAGATWLGWDATLGVDRDPPPLTDLPMPWADITATPRKYGFHATIKPPFRLAPGRDVDALTAAFAAYCARHAPVMIDALTLAPLGRFLALVPQGETQDLTALAATCVRELDDFRAPLTDDELVRRRAAGLTPAQDTLLQHWGYPYVMEAFRFHMTLTGKMPKPTLPAITAALDTYLMPHVPQPLLIDALSLVGEDAAGRFHLLHRIALSGGRRSRISATVAANAPAFDTVRT